MNTVLIITDVNFWRQGAGHRARIRSMLSWLNHYIAVEVAYTGKLEDKDLHIIAAIRSPRILIPDAEIQRSTKGYGAWVADLCTKKRFSACIIEYVFNSYLLSYLPKDIIKILDTHDIISERAFSFSGYSVTAPDNGLDWEFEVGLFALYDYVIAICEPDRRKITSVLNNKQVLMAPHPVIAKTGAVRSKAEIIGFVASEYLPNVDAINFFIHECWPAIRNANNDVQLYIYGNVVNVISKREQAGIHYIGYRDDLSSVYHQMDIAVNPVRFGAGLKIKNMEALAYGVPLVTTMHGARGLEDGIGYGFIVADNASIFSTEINRLIRQPEERKRLSINARNYVTLHFNFEKCYAPLLEVLTRSSGSTLKSN